MAGTVTSRLELLAERFAVCRLPPDAELPAVPVGEVFFSMTRTTDELSIVCPEAAAPDGDIEPGWRCFEVEGPLPFDQVGILTSIAQPLATADVGIFVISTFDTDYLLVKEDQLEATVAALTAAGHQVR